MCWQCDNPHATVEDYLDRLRDIITERRWAVQFIEGDRPFAYTIGLHDNGLPELLVAGLPPQTAKRLLNSIAHHILDGGARLQPAMHLDCQGEFLIEVVEMDHPDVHLKFAMALIDEPFRALQLVWTDDPRHWPWDRGWSQGRRSQPVLGLRSPAVERGLPE